MIPQLFEKITFEIIHPETELGADYLGDIAAAVQESKQLHIITDNHVDKASFYIKHFKQVKRNIETVRKEIVEPYNRKVRSINKDFKEIINCFESEPERLGSELTDYMRKKRELEEIERAKEQRELDDALIKEAEIFDDESVLDVDTKIEIKRERLDTQHLTTMRVKRWRITDLDLVPRRWLTLDEKTISLARKREGFDAVSNIPGIEFYTDEVARV